MGVALDSYFGSADIGLFCSVSSSFAIVPTQLSKKRCDVLAEKLKVRILSTHIAGSTIVGVLSAANANGVVLPRITLMEEVQRIENSLDSVNVHVLDGKLTGVGNLILANDHGAIVSPEFTRRELRKIQEALGVEAVQTRIAGRSYVGSIAVATNNGVVTHVESTIEEEAVLRDVLKVEVATSTVNGGVTFVRSGLIANDNGAIIGSRTTGPELMTISTALGV